MIAIRGRSGREVLFNASRRVMRYGKRVGPRGLKTQELLGVRLEIEEPWDAYPSGISRPKLSPALYVAEAAMLVGGVQVPDLLCRIAPFYRNFTNREGLLDGAYGPRIYSQMLAARRRIKRDPETRQAVVSIWDHEDARNMRTNDLPCTVNIHFLLRDEKLRTYVTMRSNDVFLGVPYDVGMFTGLQLAFARSLGVRPGLYSHDSNSLHVYERDINKVHRLRPPPDLVPRETFALGIGRDKQTWGTIAKRARLLLRGGRPRDATKSEAAIADVLTPHVRKSDVLYGP